MGKKLLGRRDFMKSGLAGFGGLFVMPSLGVKQEMKLADVKGKERKFVYRTLGRTGLKLPVVNMGVMSITSGVGVAWIGGVVNNWSTASRFALLITQRTPLSVKTL